MGLLSRKQDQSESAVPPAPRASRRKTARVRDDEFSDDPLDPATALKVRARRRLIGAVALVVGAVVVLPWVFDSEPPTGVQEISVQIPDQDTPFTPQPGALTPAPAPDGKGTGAVSALVPGAVSVGADSAPPPGTSSPAMLPAPNQTATAAASAQLVAAAPRADARPAAAKMPEKPAEKPPIPTKGADKAVPPRHDDPLALAALEGKAVAPTSVPAASPPAASANSFAIQIGAYANDTAVKEQRDKLNAAGLKSYTEVLNTPQGPRTRVRVGPFASKDAADKAHAKLKSAGLDGTVVPL